eukprot:gb/GEZN01007885.1/.p1 GENE.gb/GEZN01007885.1/~~gb/GEZN01007885.1/.p1  ORF type:complete len:352 (+),score=53.83 gb/GEZN01007885.1/:83-1138(+)
MEKKLKHEKLSGEEACHTSPNKKLRTDTQETKTGGAHDFQLLELGVQKLGAIRMAGIVRQGPFQECGPIFMKVVGIAKQAGLLSLPSVKTAHLVLTQSDTPSEIRSCPAVMLPSQEHVVPEGLQEIILPAGLYACATLKGPYSNLAKAWSQLVDEWLPRYSLSAAKPSDIHPSYEIYLNSNVAEADLMTELRILVGKTPHSKTVSIERVFEGSSVEELYGLWSNDVTRQTLTCEGSVYPEGVPEFKIGTKVKSYTCNDKGQKQCIFAEEFLEIIPNRRIVSLVQGYEPTNHALIMASTITLSFFPHRKGSLLVAFEAATCFDGTFSVEGHLEGFKAMFDHHEKLLNINQKS